MYPTMHFTRVVHVSAVLSVAFVLMLAGVIVTGGGADFANICSCAFMWSCTFWCGRAKDGSERVCFCCVACRPNHRAAQMLVVSNMGEHGSGI